MEFNEKQRVLIDLLADPTDTRTKEQKAKACGYSKKYLYELQKTEGWSEAVYERMRGYVSSNLPRVYQSLFVLATKEKNIKAHELLLKAAGEIQGAGVQVSNVLTQGQPEHADSLGDRLREATEYRRQRAENLRAQAEVEELTDQDQGDNEH